jgi:hypothetical protein
VDRYIRNAYGYTVTKRTQNSISDSRGPARTCCDARHMVRVESYGGQQESAQPPQRPSSFPQNNRQITEPTKISVSIGKLAWLVSAQLRCQKTRI